MTGILKTKQNMALICAVLAAALYAVNSPVSKILLNEIPPAMMAALLYIGAGIGMSVIGRFRYKTGRIKKDMRLTKNETPFCVAMIALDIAAPILLMIGLKSTTAENASLLNNFEIVATSLIALFVFKEAIGRRLWIAIALITISSIILSVNDIKSLSFSLGSIFVLLACVCWGFENNCTRMLSVKDPMQIVVIKGFGSGLGSLIIALILSETASNAVYIAATLILGFICYGLSIFFYVLAQRHLGAAKTSAYYAISPFIGAGLSFVIFLRPPGVLFVAALLIMIAGTYFAVTDNRAGGYIKKGQTR